MNGDPEISFEQKSDTFSKPVDSGNRSPFEYLEVPELGIQGLDLEDPRAEHCIAQLTAECFDFRQFRHN